MRDQIAGLNCWFFAEAYRRISEKIVSRKNGTWRDTSFITLVYEYNCCCKNPTMANLDLQASNITNTDKKRSSTVRMYPSNTLNSN